MDPIEIIDKVGTDSLRFSVVTGNTPGNDMKYYEEKIRAAGILQTSCGMQQGTL